MIYFFYGCFYLCASYNYASLSPSIATLAISVYSALIITSGIFLLIDYLHLFQNTRAIKRKSRVGFQQMILVIIRNNIIGNLLLYPVIDYPSSNTTQPSLFEILVDILMMFLIFDTVFYFAHRAMHQVKFSIFRREISLYKLLHRQHHTTFADTGLSTHYMGLIDFLLEILVPFWTAVILWEGHWFSVYLFAVIGTINAVITHQGMTIWGLPPPENHQTHHLKLNVNYGVGGIWDYLLETSA